MASRVLLVVVWKDELKHVVVAADLDAGLLQGESGGELIRATVGDTRQEHASRT